MKIGFVTRYYPPGVEHTFGRLALGWYTRNLLAGLPTGSIEYEIYAETLPGEPRSCRVDERTQIERCWTPGIFSVFQIARAIAAHRPDLVHIQHELGHFGPYVSALLIPLLLVFTKLIGIPTVITLHQVYPLAKMDRGFLRQYGMRVPPLLVRLAVWMAIAPTVILTDRVIVHAEKFAQELADNYGLARQMQKVSVLPLGVEDLDTGIDSGEAKEKLGLQGRRVLLFFGNLTGYKGLEILIDSMGLLEEHHDDLALVIGGRDTPGLQVSRAAGQSYSAWLMKRAGAVSSNIHFVGFIEGDDLPVYLAAADLVVLPYTLDISSSGPLALTLSYSRPFIVSSVFAGVVDLKAVMFEPEVSALAAKADQYLTDARLRQQIREYGLRLRQERLWTQVGEKTQELYSHLLSDREPAT